MSAIPDIATWFILNIASPAGDAKTATHAML